MSNEVHVVCILHGGSPVPNGLVKPCYRLDVTVNDPRDHTYGDLPARAAVTANAKLRGFAENANSALRRIFSVHGPEIACVANFDIDGEDDAPLTLAAALVADPRLGAVGAVLHRADGTPTFSAGTIPTPGKEFFRAAGLRGDGWLRRQRILLRHTTSWARRNAEPAGGVRLLDNDEYLPWTLVGIRRRAWEEVGPLDERFPLYAEDIDWSLRCHWSGWKLGLIDCGPVVHHERATRDPRSDTLYEYSHLELHRKWHWRTNLKWQRRGLKARSRWPLRVVTARLDWPRLTNLDASPQLNAGAASNRPS